MDSREVCSAQPGSAHSWRCCSSWILEHEGNCKVWRHDGKVKEGRERERQAHKSDARILGWQKAKAKGAERGS